MNDSRDAVTAEVANELRAMHAIARTVNGATPVDDPRRQTSRDFTEALAVLVEQGVTVYRLAKVLGVRHSAVYARLARYGYRAPSPSAEHKAIRDTTVWDSRRGEARIRLRTEAVRLYLEGCTIASTARQISRSYGTTRTLLLEAGVRLRARGRRTTHFGTRP